LAKLRIPRPANVANALPEGPFGCDAAAVLHAHHLAASEGEAGAPDFLFLPV
jgi:hypothetical protein